MNETFNVDFSDVGSSDSKYYLEPGSYMVKIESVGKDIKEGGEYPYLKWEFSVSNKDDMTLNVITSLSPKALFKLKELMEAVGVVVPEGAMTVNPTDYIGRVCMADVEDKTYNGKVYSNITKLKPCATQSSDGTTNNIDDLL